MKAILTTEWSGSVRVTAPALEMFDVMSSGGYWSDRPRGFLAEQIERQIADGIDPDHARRFAYALQFGGLSTAEVYAVIRDRDCARHGRNHDLIDRAELPDRWFRGAWTRGHNGGPVWVDLERARVIQRTRIDEAVADENRRRKIARARRFKLDLLAIGAGIRNARDDEELRRVWPQELPPHLSN
jgi:hypothetical protein